MENSQMDMNQDQMQGAPMENAPQDNAAEAGRGTDSVMAHLSLGEVVIPRAFLDDPQVMQMLQQIFQAGGADINQYTVGHEANSINPETGYPEFKFGLGKFLRIAAPLALSVLAPGIGTAIGGSILGAGAAGASTLGSALLGAGAGALGGGGLKGALIGGVTGGIGANLGSLGSGLQGATSTGAALDNPNGILGAVRGATGLTNSGVSSLGGILGNSGGVTGGGSSFSSLNTLGSALGGFQQDSALNKQKKQLLAAQGQQLGNLENLNPTDVQNDPGYQFNIEQGQQGLNRSLGAQGGLFSGNALKAGAEYNQNFANNYYNQAYQRQAAKVGAQNDIYGNTGNINANATLGRSNNINQTLANALGANVGAYNGANNNISTADLLALMKQRGLA